MHNQTWGIARNVVKSGVGLAVNTAMHKIGMNFHCALSDMADWAVVDYRTHRENGAVSDSPHYPADTFPRDGRFTFVEEATTHGRDYALRYDEGPGDRAWMEERDRNYIVRETYRMPLPPWPAGEVEARGVVVQVDALGDADGQICRDEALAVKGFRTCHHDRSHFPLPGGDKQLRAQHLEALCCR